MGKKYKKDEPTVYCGTINLLIYFSLHCLVFWSFRAEHGHLFSSSCLNPKCKACMTAQLEIKHLVNQWLLMKKLVLEGQWSLISSGSPSPHQVCVLLFLNYSQAAVWKNLLEQAGRQPDCLMLMRQILPSLQHQQQRGGEVRVIFAGLCGRQPSRCMYVRNTRERGFMISSDEIQFNTQLCFLPLYVKCVRQ